MKKRKRRMMRTKRIAKKTLKMKRTCRTWMRWTTTMSHLMMGRLMRCFNLESAFKNPIYEILNNVAHFIEMITNGRLFIPFVYKQVVFLLIRWTWRVLIKIKINGWFNSETTKSNGSILSGCQTLTPFRQKLSKWDLYSFSFPPSLSLMLVSMYFKHLYLSWLILVLMCGYETHMILQFYNPIWRWQLEISVS